MDKLTLLDNLFCAADSILNEPVKPGTSLRDAGFLFNRAIRITRAIGDFQKALTIVNQTPDYRG